MKEETTTVDSMVTLKELLGKLAEGG